MTSLNNDLSERAARRKAQDIAKLPGWRKRRDKHKPNSPGWRHLQNRIDKIEARLESGDYEALAEQDERARLGARANWSREIAITLDGSDNRADDILRAGLIQEMVDDYGFCPNSAPQLAQQLAPLPNATINKMLRPTVSQLLLIRNTCAECGGPLPIELGNRHVQDAFRAAYKRDRGL